MPIEIAFPFRPVKRSHYYRVIYVIRGLAFKIQNDLGRCFDEKAYQQELEHRCRLAGFNAITEGKIRVLHREFRKDYSVDLVIEDGIIYEIKAVECLVAKHQQQAINYLLLCGAQRGILLNFHSPSITFKYVSSSLTPDDRHKFSINLSSWKPLCNECNWLKNIIAELLEDWGAFLDCQLYQEAIKYFLGKPRDTMDTIPIHYNGYPLGSQRANLLTPQIGYYLSSFKGSLNYQEQQFARFLSCTRLKALQWINLYKHDITMKTIINPSCL